MNIDNIVIPGGILATWDGPQSPETQGDADNKERFDIVEVARERARSLSVSVGYQIGRRRSTLERIPSTIPPTETTHAASRQESRSTHAQRPALNRQRSKTIEIGDLARSRATGLNPPANPVLRLEPSVTSPQNHLDSANTTINLEDSYVFQRLEDYKPSSRDTAPQVSAGPLFLAGSSSGNTATLRRKSSDRHLERNPSRRSRLSSGNVARRASIAVGGVVEKVMDTVTRPLRRTSLQEVYEKAKIRQVQLTRSTVAQISFQYVSYLLMLAGIYFVFVGFPLWKGLVLVLYDVFRRQLAIPVGTAVFLGIAFLYAYLPLLITLEEEPSGRPVLDSSGVVENCQTNDTALLIPCYKSEKLIGATLEAALKVFPAQNIFVIANGNSPTPLDNTAAVCDQYGVSHTWSPIGSKIVAQFVGCYVTKRFPYVLLIDDDCLLPPNFPIVTDRIRGRTLCIGYTIKSVGPNSSKGTLCQQAQDVEYKLSGLQRAFAGKIGSATFPHGAISIWDRKLLIKTFQAHPGFSVSEDWFFGHVARQLGCRIQMCTAVFVETETPSAIFFSGGGARGGFGEMTIWKQRFYRWNYFFVSGLFWDMSYIIRRWNLGWWELGAKIFVFQEVYETLLYLLAPFVMPISFYIRPQFSGYLTAATLALYQINVLIFNYIHLRSRNESVSVLCLLYYLPYKAILTFVNIASCYYSIYKYAKYFAKRHPKIIEDEKAVAVVLRLEEESFSSADKAASIHGRAIADSTSHRARRFTVTAVGTNLSSALPQEYQQGGDTTNIDVVDFAAQSAPPPKNHTPDGLQRSTGSIPPPIPATRRQFSWHRSTSKTSSDSGISPFDEHKQLYLPLQSPEVTAVGQSLRRKSGRTPPPVPPSTRRPFSWHRSTSRTSSNSGISPFDERKQPRFPLQSPEMTAVGPSLQAVEEDDRIPNVVEPSRPDQRFSSTTLLIGSSSDRSVPLRLNFAAPRPSPPSSNPSQRRVLRHHSSSSTDLTFDLSTPSIEPPPPALVRESYRFATLSKVEEEVRRGPPRRPEPDINRYIAALADTGDPRPGSRDRLFIREEDEWEEASRKEGSIRKSTQTDRTSWSSRQRWAP